MRDENGDHNPSLGAAVTDAVDAIDAFLAEGRRVVVHCHGGRSRTGLVLRAWWMRRNTATSAEAREWIDEAWPRWENWTRDFDDFLDDVWEPLVFSGGRPR
jgi:ADP-ribosyl-[dinitrogen reductase] hydrolase